MHKKSAIQLKEDQIVQLM